MMRRALVTALTMLGLGCIALLALLSVARRWPWPAVVPVGLQVRQWREVLDPASGVGGAALRSSIMAVTVAALATLGGFVTSRGVARHPQRHRLLMMLNLPFAVSPVVLGVSLSYFFLRFDLAGHAAGVVIAQFIVAYAYAVILLSGFWNPEVAALIELAVTFGADRVQVWRRVLLPLARPLLVLCLLQTFLISWFDYALTLVVGAGRVSTLTTALYQYFGSGDLRLAATCALLLLAPPLAAIALHQRLASAAVAAQWEA